MHEKKKKSLKSFETRLLQDGYVNILVQLTLHVLNLLKLGCDITNGMYKLYNDEIIWIASYDGYSHQHAPMVYIYVVPVIATENRKVTLVNTSFHGEF